MYCKREVDLNIGGYTAFHDLFGQYNNDAKDKGSDKDGMPGLGLGFSSLAEQFTHA